MDSRPPIVVGTRGSPLAMAQARHVRALLAAAHPALAEEGALEIRVIVTSGDRLAHARLADHGGKGLFTKEIEEALLDGRIDLAVHSMKDLPTRLPDGLTIAAIPERADPRDVLVAPKARGTDGLPPKARGTDGLPPKARGTDGLPPKARGTDGLPPKARGTDGLPPKARGTDGLPPKARGTDGLPPKARGTDGLPPQAHDDLPPKACGLPAGARVGTSSLRRQAQLLARRPDLVVVPLRGNVGTRLRKVADGAVDAALLALAGLRRLGVNTEAMTVLAPEEMLPAVGQGALGIECRAGDSRMTRLLAPLAHRPSADAVRCERALLETLDGSCRTPIAGLAVADGAGGLRLDALVASPDGRICHRVSRAGPAAEAAALGRDAGAALKAAGAARLLP